MATKAQVKLSAKIYFCALVAKMFGHQRNQRRLYETTLIPNMFFDQIGPKVGRARLAVFQASGCAYMKTYIPDIALSKENLSGIGPF